MKQRRFKRKNAYTRFNAILIRTCLSSTKPSGKKELFSQRPSPKQFLRHKKKLKPQDFHTGRDISNSRWFPMIARYLFCQSWNNNCLIPIRITHNLFIMLANPDSILTWTGIPDLQRWSFIFKFKLTSRAFLKFISSCLIINQASRKCRISARYRCRIHNVGRHRVCELQL